MKIKNDTSGINYANLSNANVAWNIPVKSDGTYRLGSSKNDMEYADEDGITPIFNAVEIDWNGADLSAATPLSSWPTSLNTNVSSTNSE